MMKFIRFSGLFLFSGLLILSVIVQAAYAGEAEGNGVVKRLIALVDVRYKGLKAFEATFLQRTVQPGGSVVEARGRVYLQPPSKMRWEYASPERQFIITSGDEIYVYEPDEAQVMVMGKGGFLSKAISQAFFWGKHGLEGSFEVRAVCHGRGEECAASSFAAASDPERSLLLIPRKELRGQGVEAIVAEIDTGTGAIARMWLKNEMGAVTYLEFSGIKWNRPHDDEFFRFHVPEGVTVYRDVDDGEGSGTDSEKVQ